MKNVFKLIILSLALLAYSGMTYGQQQQYIGAVRPQDTSISRGQLSVRPWAGTGIRLIGAQPDGGSRAYTLGFGVIISGTVISADTSSGKLASQNYVINGLAGKQDALGYTPENVANKVQDNSSPNATTYPSTKATVNTNGYVNIVDYGASPANSGSANVTAIRAAVASGAMAIKFPKGIFLIDDRIALQTGQRVFGEGDSSVLLNNNDYYCFIINSQNNISISNMTLRGSAANINIHTRITRVQQVLTDSGAGNGIGVFIVSGEGITIDNVNFQNFGYAGLLVYYTGEWSDPTATLGTGLACNNLKFTNCYHGIKLAQNAEYSRFNNIVSFNCVSGFTKSTGNNIVSNSQFTDCVVGALIDTASNNAHGNWTGCLFNHNTLNGIYCHGITNGEIFTGCQSWSNSQSLWVDNCKGVEWIGGIIASPVIVKNITGYVNSIIGTEFRSEAAYNVSITNNGTANSLILQGNFWDNDSESSYINNRPTLQEVTNHGAVTTNAITFTGTSTFSNANFRLSGLSTYSSGMYKYALVNSTNSNNMELAATIPYSNLSDTPRATTYTPTVTNVTNISSSSLNGAWYLRVGNSVTVHASITLQNTTLGTAAELRISLPIASDLTNSYDLIGIANPTSTTGRGAGIVADVTNDAASMQWLANVNSSAATWIIEFSYLIK